ncbi:hypothetical protein MMRN_46100 [Mycobacterium marinum]|nr:hypothetical protein MMRN_46100 [Mycobacterium marinum]
MIYHGGHGGMVGVVGQVGPVASPATVKVLAASPVPVALVGMAEMLVPEETALRLLAPRPVTAAGAAAERAAVAPSVRWPAGLEVTAAMAGPAAMLALA